MALSIYRPPEHRHQSGGVGEMGRGRKVKVKITWNFNLAGSIDELSYENALGLRSCIVP